MLQLERLSARYGRIAALDSVSLTVGPAEFVCLIGANGAGKTTTLKTISGLVRAAAGRIVSAQEISLAPQESAPGHRPTARRAGAFPHDGGGALRWAPMPHRTAR
jgi:branched-chain amino acid transport system ATP-binding protein